MQTVQLNILTGVEYLELADGRDFGNKYHGLGLWASRTKKEDIADSYEKLSLLDKITVSAIYKKTNPKLITQW